MAVDESQWREYRVLQYCSKCGASEWYMKDGEEGFFCGPCERAVWIERFRFRKNLPGELGTWLIYIWLGYGSLVFIAYKILTGALRLNAALAGAALIVATVFATHVVVVWLIARCRWREEQNRKYGFGGWREIK